MDKQKRVLTLDCEIAETLEKGDERWNDPLKLTLTVCCFEWQPMNVRHTHWYCPDSLSVDEIGNHFPDTTELFQNKLDNADLVVSFNGESFDFPLLEGTGFDMGNAWDKSYDIMAEFAKAAEHRISLDNLAYAVLGQRKKMTGYDAPKLWNSADYLVSLADSTESGLSRDTIETSAKYLYSTVIDYCLDDVRLTREIFNTIAARGGEVVYDSYKYPDGRKIKLFVPEEFRTDKYISTPGADGLGEIPMEVE